MHPSASDILDLNYCKPIEPKLSICDYISESFQRFLTLITTYSQKQKFFLPTRRPEEIWKIMNWKNG